MNSIVFISIFALMFALIIYLLASAKKERESYIKKLVEEGNNTSTTNAMVVGVFILVALIILVLLVLMIFDTFKDGEMPSDMTGISLIITACTSMLGAVGFVKAYKYKHGKNRKFDREDS